MNSSTTLIIRETPASILEFRKQKNSISLSGRKGILRRIPFRDKLKFQYILQNMSYKLIALVQERLNFDSENLGFTKVENQLRTCSKNITTKSNAKFLKNSGFLLLTVPAHSLSFFSL